MKDGTVASLTVTTRTNQLHDAFLILTQVSSETYAKSQYEIAFVSWPTLRCQRDGTVCLSLSVVSKL